MKFVERSFICEIAFLNKILFKFRLIFSKNFRQIVAHFLSFRRSGESFFDIPILSC